MIIDKNWDEIWKIVQRRAQITQPINRQQWQQMQVAKRMFGNTEIPLNPP